MTQGSVRDTTGYVNYVYNISARGTTQVVSQLMGLSNVAGSVLGQLAFQTSSYLSHTEGALMSMGIVATAGFTKAVQKASEFDQALATIGAISGKTTSEVSGLGQEAIEMSNKFGMAVGEMTTGLEALARAGVSTGNMNAILEQAMGLSKLEGLSLETAINDLISTTNLLDTKGLDLESPEYAEAVKQQNQRITATSEAAPINAQDIIHTLEHVGGYASSTNLDQEDLFAVIAQLGSKGTKSEMAGTSLRAFLAAGQKDTAQRALKRIGLDVSDLWKNDDTILSITDMKDVLDQAMEAKGYTKQEKLEFYSDFAGYKQANQIMKIDTQSAREFKEKIDRSWDMGKKIEQVIGTAETHIQGLMQAGTNLLIKVGEPFLPIVSTIAATLKTGIDIINMIPGSNFIIAGGLILASVKGISTIFNKIVPQLVASRDNLFSVKGLFTSIREDLTESFTLLKNINNTDFMKERAQEIEASRIDEQDKMLYWREARGRRADNIVDVWQLEREHGFKHGDDTPYVDWKRQDLEERNKRQKQKSTPKRATESSNNREQNRQKTDNKEQNKQKSICCDLIVQVMKEGFVNQIYNTNTIKDRVIDIYNTISLSLNKIKDTTFKVIVVNSANNVIPMHDVGQTKYKSSQKYLKNIENKTNDDKVDDRKRNKQRHNVSNTSSSDEVGKQNIVQPNSSINMNKLKTARLFTLDDPHITEKKLSEFADILADSVDFGFDTNTSEGQLASEYLKNLLHEVFLKNARTNGVFYKGGTQQSLISTINRALHGPTMLSDGSTKIGGVEGFASSKLDSILANTEGYKNYTSNDIDKITDRGIFRKDWDYDVNKRRKTENEWIQRGKDFLTTLQHRGNPMVEIIHEEVKLNEEGHKFVGNVIKNVNNMGIKRKEQLARDFGILGEKWEEQKHLFSNEELHYMLNQDIEKKIMNGSGTNRYKNAVKLNKYLPKTKQISKLSNNPIETVKQISLSNLGENFTTTQYKEIVQGLNDYFHFEISTKDIENEEQKIIKEINNSDLTSKEREIELNSVKKNAYKNIVTEKIDTLLKSDILDDDLIGFAQYLQPKLERPTDKNIFDSIGFNYNAFTDTNKISKRESTELIELLAYLNDVSLKGLKTDAKSYRANVAKRIMKEPGKINIAPIQEMYNDPMTYFFMNDLGVGEQQQFIKQMGLKNTKPLFALYEYMQGVKSGNFDYEEGYNLIKQLGHITEFEEDKLNIAGGYYGSLNSGPNVSSSPNKEVERILKTYGEDGYHGLISYMNEISNTAMEIVTQMSLDDIEKALQERRGEKGKVNKKEIVKMVDNLRRNRRATHNYHQITEGSEDDLGLLETIIEGLWHRTDSKKTNEIKKTKHSKSKWGMLEGTRFILDPDPNKWEEFTDFIIDIVSAGGISSNQVPDTVIWSKAMKDMLNFTTDLDSFQRKIQTSENIGPLRQTGTAELEPLSYIFEGMRINTFQRKPTHGRNMENTAVINDAGQLVGFQANAHGDYREAYNWALERRRNKIYLEEDQKDAYAAIALRTGLSRYDIRSMGLTDYQKAEAEEMYKNQDFVSIPDFIKKYDELYAKGESDFTGEQAFRQLRGQMASSNKVDDKGNIIGNMFHRTVTLKEYEQLKKLGLINLNEGNQGVLSVAEKDKNGNALKYNINDYSMLHYSKEDIERNIQLRDIGRALKAEQGYTQDFDLARGADPLKIARDLLTKRPTEMSNVLESIYVYDKTLANNILYYAQAILLDEIKHGKLQGIGVTPTSELTKTMDTAYKKNDFLNIIENTFGEDVLGYFDDSFLNDMFEKVYGANDNEFDKVSTEVLGEMINYYNDIVNAGLDDLKELNLTEAQQSDFLSALEVGSDSDWGAHMQYEGNIWNPRLEDVIDPQTHELITNEFGQAIYALGDEAISKQKVYNPKTGKHELVDVESSIGILADQLGQSLDSERSDNVKAVLLRLNRLKEFAQIRKEEWDNSFLGGIDVKAYNSIDSTSPQNDTEETVVKKSAQKRKRVLGEGNPNTANPPAIIPLPRAPLDTEAYMRTERFINKKKEQISGMVSSGVDKIYNTVGTRDNSHLTEPLMKISSSAENASMQLRGFTNFLEKASEKFPPLTIAVMALEGVLYGFSTGLEAMQGMTELLNLKNTIQNLEGNTFSLFGMDFEKDSNQAKMLLSLSSVVGQVVDTILGFVTKFYGPLLLIAGALTATKIALDWSYKSHEKYLKQLQDEEKANKSKSKSLQVTNEQNKKALLKNRNETQEDVLMRKYQLSHQKLESANLTRTSGALKLTGAENDTLWGKYGVASAFDKMQGKYESTAADYDGTSGQIRRIKEHTTGGQSFLRGMPGYYSQAEEMVAAYYDANKLAIGVMDEYKDELGELYDAETNSMKKHPGENPRETKEFQQALNKFTEATGITKEHAQQYLDYMQTEHNVDNATQAMQAQADLISANTEMKVQAIAFGGNPSDVLGLNGIEAQQNAMVQAQADMIQLELSSQLWWKAVWATITTPIKAIMSPIFAIAHILGAIWAFVTGNWDSAGMHMQQAGASLNVLGEATTYWDAWGKVESTDFNSIGQSAIDENDRANYGNAASGSSGGGVRVPVQQDNSIFGMFPVGLSKSNKTYDEKDNRSQLIQNAQQSFFSQLLSPITTTLNLILVAITGGILITSVGALANRVKGLPDFLGKTGGIVETLKNGNILDTIKNGNVLDTIKSGNVLNVLKNTGSDAFTRVKNAKEDFLGKNAWGNYLGEKIMTDDFSKRKRKGMNASDREYLNRRYDLGIDFDEKDENGRRKYRTDKQKNKAVRQALDDKGQWDEAMLDLHNNNYVGDSIKRRVTGKYNEIKEDYANPWKEYIGGKVDNQKAKAKDYLSELVNQAELYNTNPESVGMGKYDKSQASMPVKILGEMFGVRDKIFGEEGKSDFSELISNPKEFLSDPRNIEKMGKNVYSNYKNKYQKAKEDPAAQEEYDWYKEGGGMRFMDLSRENKIRAVGDKLSNVKHNVFGMEQGESIQEMLKNPERTMEVLKTGIDNMRENGVMESLGLDEDFGITDATKEKISGLFDQVKEGITDSLDEDDENASFIDKAKKKIAGFFGWTKEEGPEYNKDVLNEEMDWYKAGELDFNELSHPNQMNVDPHLERDVFGKQKHKNALDKDEDETEEDIQSEEKTSRLQNLKSKMTNLFHRDEKDLSEENIEEEKITPIQKSGGLFDTFRQMHNIDKDAVKEEYNKNKTAAKSVLTGKAFNLNPEMDVEGQHALRQSGLLGEKPMNVLDQTFKEESAGAYADGASVLDLDSLGDMNDGLKTGGKIAQKAGGFLKGKKGIAGKAGNVLERIGGGASKAGSKGIGGIAKGGISKLGKTGIGKAVSGIGKKAIGGIGKKLATKGIAQVGSKVLGGALMATGIGAPLGLLLESPIGGALIEGAMNLGGKALGAVGGAIGGIGKALGFGRSAIGKKGGGGGLLKGLAMASPLGMMAGAAGGLLGGVFGGKGPGNMGKMGGPLQKMAVPLGGMVGMLGKMFSNDKQTKSLNEKMEAHAGKTLEAVREQNAKTTPSSNSSGGNITIQNININTADDPEAIKAMFLELIVELQEQVNPRLVSRTAGKAPESSTSTAPTDDTSTEDTSTDKNNATVGEGTTTSNGNQTNSTN